MSILQNRHELRYIRRQNLEEEAKVFANYYRDLIRAYGVDVRYFKLHIPFPETFTDTVTQNSLLMHAYGYDDHPKYKLACNVITYMEVDNDILSLNRLGAMPTTDATFFFDSVDFATALAPQLGKLREFPVQPQHFVVEAFEDELEGLKVQRKFKSELLSGEAEFDFTDIEVSLEQRFRVAGRAVSASKPFMLFPANEDLYKSFNYRLTADDCEDLAVSLDCFATRRPLGGVAIDCKLTGAVLFHDLTGIGKYATEITPQVGDIVTIDFPDEFNREQFEITSCTDKQLTTDGLNPLLHRYIWRCKAKRYINGDDDFPERNLANQQVAEKFDVQTFAAERITEKISKYDDNQDLVYGGYTRDFPYADVNATRVPVDPGEGTMEVIAFGNGSRLVTDGFGLFFQTTEGKVYPVVTIDDERCAEAAAAPQQGNLQFLRAIGDAIYFVSLDGQATKLHGPSKDESNQDLMDPEKLEPLGRTDISLNGGTDTVVRYDSRTDTFDPNARPGQFFFKFPNSRLYLASTGQNLVLKGGGKTTLLA